MQNSIKELTPVEYGSTGVKTLNFSYNENHLCFPLHWHDRMELIKPKYGSMEIKINEGIVTLNSNEIYIIPPKTPHTAISKSNVEYDVIMFDVRSFYNETPLSLKFLESLFNGKARFNIKTDNENMIECYNQILIAQNNDSLKITSLIYEFISLLFKYCLTEFDNSTKNDTVISSAIKYIEENYSDDITTEVLSKKFGYSSAHFCRKFKNETWLTPMNYLKIYRLEASAKLLKQGKHSVNEIAMLSGFDDANYFTRCFKAHFGVPPTKYIH